MCQSLKSEISFFFLMKQFLWMKHLYDKINHLKRIQFSWDLKEQHLFKPSPGGDGLSLQNHMCAGILSWSSSWRGCAIMREKGWIIIHEVTRLRPAPVDVISLCTFPKTGSKFNVKIRREANECEMDKNHASCFRGYYTKKVRTYNTYSNPILNLLSLCYFKSLGHDEVR